MLKRLNRNLGILVIVLGLIGIGLGGLFVGLGFQKAQMITDRMVEQNITYTGAGGDIQGVIDNAQEAQAMANVLAEHSAAIGNYSQLSKDDPKRAQILQALTMESSLEMAVMGYGLTDVVKGTGAFMILAGGTFALIGITLVRSRKQEIS